MHRWLKISHRGHSGRLKPHEYTSYGPLMLVLVVVGVLLTISTVSAGTLTSSGSVGLTGIMPGPPPTTAATIAVPGTGESFTTSPITVRGTCPQNTLVEIFKNNIFAGSTACDSTGNYSLSIDLLI